MIIRLEALRSLRWNYTRKGVWFWLKGRKRCRRCKGSGEGTRRSMRGFYIGPCIACGGTAGKRGYQRILSEPERVIAEQEAAAEGVFV